MRAIIVFVLLILLCTAPVPGALCAVRYTVRELQTPAGVYTAQPQAINNFAQVAGRAEVRKPDGMYYYACLWDTGGSFTMLGAPPPDTDTWAYDLNDAGCVVGDSAHLSSPQVFNAFAWHDGVFQPLPGLGGLRCGARGINNDGFVVGYSTLASDSHGHAVLWNAGVPQELEMVGGFESSYAYCVNDGGLVAGTSARRDLMGWELHLVVWENGAVRDLGFLGYGYDSNSVTGMNNGGHIVGTRQPDDMSSTRFGFLADAAGVHDLPLLPGCVGSRADDINSQGQIVGACFQRMTPAVGFPVIWDDGRITDVNMLIDPASGWTVSYVIRINDNGVILGTARRSGWYVNVLLFPVPEPASFFAVLCGLTGLAALTRGRSSRPARRTSCCVEVDTEGK